MSWVDSAQCSGDDPAKYVLNAPPFFVRVAKREQTAWALCRDCPVRRECAEDALIHRDIGVVRGGVWLDAGKKGSYLTKTAKRQLIAAALRGNQHA